jgi:hypothetical protein
MTPELEAAIRSNPHGSHEPFILPATFPRVALANGGTKSVSGKLGSKMSGSLSISRTVDEGSRRFDIGSPHRTPSHSSSLLASEFCPMTTTEQIESEFIDSVLAIFPRLPPESLRPAAKRHAMFSPAKKRMPSQLWAIVRGLARAQCKMGGDIDKRIREKLKGWGGPVDRTRLNQQTANPRASDYLDSGRNIRPKKR